MYEFRFHLTEGRLWALSFPQEAEHLSFALALDTTSHPGDRDLAIDIVGVLASLGNPRAEQLLCELIMSELERVAASATQALAASDAQGRHRELYRQRARRSDLSAIEVLSEWVDDGTKSVLKEIVAREAGIERERAWQSLSRLIWLEADNWATRLTSILSSRGRMALQGEHFDWALRVARHRSLPGLLDLLRQRLNEVEGEHVELSKVAWGDAEGYDVNHVYEQDFTGSFLVASIDWHFDDVLKAYAELGGNLTDLEQQRLHNIGYGNDPRKRLFEFVKDWK
jgi:hypothetical protein